MDPSEIPPNGLCTRSEELEIDDVSKDAEAHFIEKMEAKPWGTLRLMDFGERFNDAVIVIFNQYTHFQENESSSDLGKMKKTVNQQERNRGASDLP